MTSIHELIERVPSSALNWMDVVPAVIIRDYDGKRWFLATDAARGLGYSKYEDAIKKHTQPHHIKRFGELKDNNATILTKVRPRDDWRFLSEEGLYHFIITSKRKPKAKAIKAKYFDQ